jgi:nitroreductase
MMIDAIKNRISIRTYSGQKITNEDSFYIETLIKEVNQMKGPFGNSIKLFYYDQNHLSGNNKIGTYGFVKNAPIFIGGITENKPLHLIDFGFLFEYLILKLTEKDLGTVWLGGTFNRSKLSYLIKEDELIPAITPVGYKEDKKSLMDKTIRKFSRGDHRKPLDELFFNESFDKKIEINQLSAEDLLYYQLISFAPSASNKQPWRFIVRKHSIDLFIEKNKNYASMLSYDIQLLDMGIALCHMVFATNKKTEIKMITNHKIYETESKKYIATIIFL